MNLRSVVSFRGRAARITMPRLGGALRDCGTYDRARSADGGDARRRRRRRRRRLVVTDWFAHARERGIRESRVGRRIAARLKLVRVLLFYSVLLGRGIGVA